MLTEEHDDNAWAEKVLIQYTHTKFLQKVPKSINSLFIKKYRYDGKL